MDNRIEPFQFQFITHRTDKYNHGQSAKIALWGGCKWIQLRVKDKNINEVKNLALYVKLLCRIYKAVFLLNDHVELCKEIHADGVHLGKTDMNPHDARKLLGNKAIIGCTCNSFEDIQALKNAPIDYIGLGPFRFTDTKEKLSPVLGLESCQQILSRCVEDKINIPIVAVGGINANDILPLKKIGIKGIAVSSAILQAENPIEEAKKIHSYASAF
jgi:thiamine-phosphate pyrophosphorylase